MRTTSTRTCVRPLPKYASRRSNKQPRRIISKKTGHGRDEPRPWRSQSGYEFAVSALRGAESIEPLLLLVAKRCIKLLERGLHGLHRAQHGVEPLAHGLDPAGRRARQRRRARRLDLVERLGGCAFEFVEDSALGVVRFDRLRDPLDRPIRQPGGLTAAQVGFHASAGCEGSAARAAAIIAAATVIAAVIGAVSVRRSDRGIGAAIARRIGAEHAVVEVIVGIGPERVIRIRIEGVVHEVVIGVRPEQRADEPDHDRAGKTAPPLRIEEAALEGRRCKRARAGVAGRGQAGKSLVAQHAAGEGARITGSPRARCRWRNGAGHLILRNHALLCSSALLWSGARRLVLLNPALLRRHVLLWSRVLLWGSLLWSGVAGSARGRRNCAGAARSGLPRQILPLTRLGHFRTGTAAGSAGARLRLLRGRGPRRRRVARHGRSCT